MQPSSNRRERVLVYGRSNSGKSSCWLSIATWAADTGTDFHIYVGDTDNAWDAMGYEDIQKTVYAEHVRDYRDAIQWARKTRDSVKGNDWVVFDMASKAWPWAQEHYFSTYVGDDDLLLGDVYLKDQKAMNKEDDGESMGGAHGSNWGVIYKYYNGLINMVLNMPCHVLFVAGAKEIRPDTNPAIINQYKGVGFYPAGPPNENELAHNFHTVLFCAETPRSWIYTTIKERGPINKPTRKTLKGTEVTDFVTTYLFQVAGWRP